MAYRLSRPDKWGELWWLNLPPDAKFLWQFLSDRCNDAGFFEIHFPSLIASTGMTEAELKKALNNLKDHYVHTEDKSVLWLKGFLREQRKLPLNPANNEHKAIVSILDEYLPRFKDKDAIQSVMPSDEDRKKSRNSKKNPGNNSGTKKEEKSEQINPTENDKVKNEVGKTDEKPFDEKETLVTSSPIVTPVEKEEKENKKPFKKPTLEQAIEYFAEMIAKNPVIKDIVVADQIAKAFMDYYDANGWRLGGKANTKMQDWKATVRRWISNRENSVLVEKKKLKSDGNIDGTKSGSKSKAELIMSSTKQAQENIDWNRTLTNE